MNRKNKWPCELQHATSALYYIRTVGGAWSDQSTSHDKPLFREHSHHITHITYICHKFLKTELEDGICRSIWTKRAVTWLRVQLSLFIGQQNKSKNQVLVALFKYVYLCLTKVNGFSASYFSLNLTPKCVERRSGEIF